MSLDDKVKRLWGLFSHSCFSKNLEYKCALANVKYVLFSCLMLQRKNLKFIFE